MISYNGVCTRSFILCELTSKSHCERFTVIDFPLMLVGTFTLSKKLRLGKTSSIGILKVGEDVGDETLCGLSFPGAATLGRTVFVCDDGLLVALFDVGEK